MLIAKVGCTLDKGNLSEDEANLFLSDIVMNLLLEEDLDVADGPEISLVGQLSEMQWSALLPQIRVRIVLENANQQQILIAAAKAQNIPALLIEEMIHAVFT